MALEWLDIETNLLVFSAVVNVGLVGILLGFLNSLKLLSLLLVNVSSDHGSEAKHSMLVY